MNELEKQSITILATINAPVSKVWQYWTEPSHITKWNSASPDWHTPRAENDLREGGKFSSRMEAKDGSMGFDFGGTYDKIINHQLIQYTLGDERKVEIHFAENNGLTEITEIFDPETTNTIELQRTGWQAILDNFKKYVEEN